MLDQRHWEPPDRERIARGNVTRLRALMREQGVDAVILNRSDNVRYVAGVNPTDNIIFTNRQVAIVFRDAETPTLFAASHYTRNVMEGFWIADVRSLPRLQAMWPSMLETALREHGMGLGAVVLLDAFMFWGTGRELERQLSDFEVGDAGELMAAARMRKSDDEVEAIEAACALGEISMDVGFERAAPGISEVELAAVMSFAALSAGAEGLYARRGTLVSSGRKLTMHMESPTRKQLRRNEFVLMDVGPMVNGYYCDFARTVFLGEPTATDVSVYQTCHTALQAAIGAMAPGVRGAQLDDAAQSIIQEAGLARFGTPVVAHGVGAVAQEPPYIVRQEVAEVSSAEAADVVLEVNMTLAVSTGIFIPGKAACRFEETVLVTDDGARVLSRSPFPGEDRFLHDKRSNVGRRWGEG